MLGNCSVVPARRAGGGAAQEGEGAAPRGGARGERTPRERTPRKRAREGARAREGLKGARPSCEAARGVPCGKTWLPMMMVSVGPLSELVFERSRSPFGESTCATANGHTRSEQSFACQRGQHSHTSNRPHSPWPLQAFGHSALPREAIPASKTNTRVTGARGAQGRALARGVSGTARISSRTGPKVCTFALLRVRRAWLLFGSAIYLMPAKRPQRPAAGVRRRWTRPGPPQSKGGCGA